jgi:predicted nucleic acid-binding protein
MQHHRRLCARRFSRYGRFPAYSRSLGSAAENGRPSLAAERNIAIIVLDDEKAFRRALEQGLTPVRSFRVLLLAKRKGLIPSVKTAMDAMIANGEGIQEELYRRMLSEAGERAKA